MDVAHDDTSVLLDALDQWFAILRRRYKIKLPLKPLKGRPFRDVPDLDALYSYTDGAWEDHKTPLKKPFFPENWFFYPSSFRSRWQVSDIIEVWSEVGEFDIAEQDGYRDQPARVWEGSVPILQYVHDTVQVSVITGPIGFQAVAEMNFDNFAWRARRLHDLFLWAIELEEAGELDWFDHCIRYVDNLEIQQRVLNDPTSRVRATSTWPWEPLE